MYASRLAPASAVCTLALSLVGIHSAVAEDPNTFSANIGAVSNYIWRGVTQTQDGPAIQGGLDYAHSSGFYLGTWASNVDFNDEGDPQDVTIALDPETGLPYTDDNGDWVGTTSGSSNAKAPTYEVDVYTGFGGKLNDDFKWDVNAIYYIYPDGRMDSNFAEIGAKGTYKWITAGLAYTVYAEAEDIPDVGDVYYYGALDFALPYDFAFNARGGYYDYTNSDGTSYGHWGAGISRTIGEYGTVSFNYDQNGGNEANYDNDPQIWVGWKKTF